MLLKEKIKESGPGEMNMIKLAVMELMEQREERMTLRVALAGPLR